MKIIAMALTLILVILGLKYTRMSGELERINEENVLLYSQILDYQEQYEKKFAERTGINSQNDEWENLSKWFISPTKEGFAEAVQAFAKLGYEDAQGLLFRRIIEEEINGYFMQYISAKGVRLYRHEYLMNSTVSSVQEFWDKSLYNSALHKVENTHDVVIPEEYMIPRREYEEFMNKMDQVFIKK